MVFEVPEVFPEKIYLNLHYAGATCNNYGTFGKTEHFGVLFYESVDCSFTLYQFYLEVLTRVLFSSLNKNFLPILEKGYSDKKRKTTFEFCGGSIGFKYLTMSSDLLYKCIEYINANADYTSSEQIVSIYRKNVDYSSPILDMNNKIL